MAACGVCFIFSFLGCKETGSSLTVQPADTGCSLHLVWYVASSLPVPFTASRGSVETDGAAKLALSPGACSLLGQGYEHQQRQSPGGEGMMGIETD